MRAITYIIWHEGWNPEVYRNVYNKNSSGKISSLCEAKQEKKQKRRKENKMEFIKGITKNEN